MPMIQSKSLIYRKIIAHAMLWTFLAVIIFPAAMVITTSFREGNFASGDFIPTNPTLDHWRLAVAAPGDYYNSDDELCSTTECENSGTYKVTLADGSLKKPPFPVLGWLWNSVKVAGISALLIVVLSTTSAYAFARMKFGGKAIILKGMMIFQMFPSVLALVALYALFSKIGEYIPWLGLGTHGGLILANMGGIALHVWTIRGYFQSIDGSLEEAAAIDGATPWQAFRLVLLPLSVPILAVVFILAFVAVVTEYPMASVLLNGPESSYTLAVGVKQYFGAQNVMWGDFAAAAVLTAFPITAVFLMAQKWLVGGLTAGGVKG